MDPNTGTNADQAENRVPDGRWNQHETDPLLAFTDAAVMEVPRYTHTMSESRRLLFAAGPGVLVWWAHVPCGSPYQ